MPFTPEIIKGDPLYELIVKLVIEHKPKSILEIGSANGLGSTKAFIEGIQSAGIEKGCILYCIEANFERFYEACKNAAPLKFVLPINACSVPLEKYIDQGYIETFLHSHGEEFNVVRLYTSDIISKWFEDEVKMIKDGGVSQNGISKAKELNRHNNFDMVFIDGSAFTGMADCIEVYGSNVIIMDDTMDIKCNDPMNKLKADNSYKLIAENTCCRNGYAAFERRGN